jgi:hypothetical protein
VAYGLFGAGQPVGFAQRQAEIGKLPLAKLAFAAGKDSPAHSAWLTLAGESPRAQSRPLPAM